MLNDLHSIKIPRASYDVLKKLKAKIWEKHEINIQLIELIVLFIQETDLDKIERIVVTKKKAAHDP